MCFFIKTGMLAEVLEDVNLTGYVRADMRHDNKYSQINQHDGTSVFF